MASDEVRKKWGTIFMGDREASVEQLKAMQAHVNREKLEKEQTEDYMERVKARAADRAREILGAAYAERQKVLEEARGEAAAQKRLAAQECVKIKAEGEELRKKAEEELKKAQTELEEAERIRAGAHEEGYQAGMDQAGRELHEFRADMGQSVAALLRSIERQQKNILEAWRNDLVELTKAAVEAGTGFVLQKEHDAILRSLVFQSLDLLENRSVVSLRVNPADEEGVSDLFRAARERAPELKQWVVTGDESLEPGSIVAESGTGSVDLRRNNFRELVNNVLEHLGLSPLPGEESQEQEMARLVEQEVAHIASLSPEPEPVAPPETEEQEEVVPEENVEAVADQEKDAPPVEDAPQPQEKQEQPDSENEHLENEPPENEHLGEEMPEGAPALDEAAEPRQMEAGGDAPSLAELEDELFPLEEETPAAENPESAEPAQEELDSKTLSEGGFL